MSKQQTLVLLKKCETSENAHCDKSRRQTWKVCCNSANPDIHIIYSWWSFLPLKPHSSNCPNNPPFAPSDPHPPSFPRSQHQDADLSFSDEKYQTNQNYFAINPIWKITYCIFMVNMVTCTVSFFRMFHDVWTVIITPLVFLRTTFLGGYSSSSSLDDQTTVSSADF